jgi:hypothetical protein
MLTSSINVANWLSKNTASTQANSKDHLTRAIRWTSFNPDRQDDRLRQAAEPQ